MNNKIAWIGLPCVTALLLALMACSPGTEPSAQASVAAPAPLRQATVLLSTGLGGSWPTGLDPASNTTGGANISMMNAIFGGLFQLTADADGTNPQVTGVLAESYEFTDENRTLLVRLRPGLKFSDGSPFDAEAVKAHVLRAIAAPCTCAPTRWPWTKDDRATVVDPQTVALHFTRPYAAAIHDFPISSINWVASAAAHDAMGDADFRLKPVGAGPFRIVSNQPSARLVLERNPNYWDRGRPSLDRLTFLPVGSEQSAYLALLSGDAQVAEGITSTQVIARAMQEKKIKVTPQPPTAPYVIQLNTTIAPFDDQRAREAIYYATDVPAIRRGLFNDWYPASQSFTAPGGLFHREKIPGYREFDLERAKALVKQIGGVKVHLGTIKTEVAEQVVTALQSQWQKAGMEVTIDTYEMASVVQQFRSKKWQAMLQTAGSFDPEAAGGVSFRFRSNQPFSGVRDPQLDELLLQAAGEVDPTRRGDLYFQAARVISDKAYAPFLFAFAPTQFAASEFSGTGLTTRVPPVFVNTSILWQDVKVGQ